MAVSTFGGIKTAVADWLERSDLGTAISADFFPMMQAKMYFGHGRDIEPLRNRARQRQAWTLSLLLLLAIAALLYDLTLNTAATESSALSGSGRRCSSSR